MYLFGHLIFLFYSSRTETLLLGFINLATRAVSAAGRPAPGSSRCSGKLLAPACLPHGFRYDVARPKFQASRLDSETGRLLLNSTFFFPQRRENESVNTNIFPFSYKCTSSSQAGRVAEQGWSGREAAPAGCPGGSRAAACRTLPLHPPRPSAHGQVRPGVPGDGTPASAGPSRRAAGAFAAASPCPLQRGPGGRAPLSAPSPTSLLPAASPSFGRG